MGVLLHTEFFLPPTQRSNHFTRRFPEDALTYYQYAMAKGGNAPKLMNKMGLTQLELRNVVLARAYFQRVVKMSKKDPEAWNNLGAVEYLDGASASAIS